MPILELLFTGGVAAAILFFLGASYSFMRFLGSRKQLAKLPMKRFKSKKKRKRVAHKRKQIIHKRKKFRTAFVVCLLLAFSFAGGTAYISYYQSMTLTPEDSKATVRGYYLLRDFEEQLLAAKNKRQSEEELQQNISYLATSMASYGIKKASNRNSTEGQLALNRYYNLLKQLGMNATTQANLFFENPTLVDNFLRDIENVQTYEKVAFDYYKVDEAAFSKEQQ